MNEKINYFVFPDISLSKTIENVLQELCYDLNTDMYSITKKCRKREIIDKRHIMMFVLNKYCRLTTTRIGQLLEYDHATVIHACKKVDDLKLLDSYKTNFKKFLTVRLLNEKQYPYHL